MSSNSAEYTRKYRENPENLEKHRAANRKYALEHAEERAEYKRKWRATEVGKESHGESARRDRERHPDQHRARGLVNTHVARGKIIKPSECSECGAECSPHAHHEDYSKPLEVVWLCPKCHAHHH